MKFIGNSIPFILVFLLLSCGTSSNVPDAFNPGLISPLSISIMAPATIVQIQSLDLNNTDVRVPNGFSQNYIVRVNYTDGSSRVSTNEVTWTTRQRGLGTITAGMANGVFNIRGTGISSEENDVEIIAQWRNLEASFRVTVTDATLDSLTVSPSSATIEARLTQQFAASGTFTDGQVLDISDSVTWTSSNTTTATINAHGVATGGTYSSTPVTIKASHSGLEPTAALTVTPGLQSIAITINPNMITDANYSISRQALGTYDDGAVRDITNLATWTAWGGFNSTVAFGSPNIIAADCYSAPRGGWGGSWIGASLNGVSSEPGTLSCLRSESDEEEDDDSVLCTEMHRQGFLPTAIYKADAAYGRTRMDPQTVLNYQAWAIPVTKWMRQSPLLTQALRPLVSSWAYEMAYRMGAYPTSNVMGRFIVDYGTPVSNAIGATVLYFRSP